MNNKEKLEKIFIQYNFKDFKWIDPKEIVVSNWVRMKCMFGCSGFGDNACCPPNTPTVDECKNFFQEYNEGVIFHFVKKIPKPELRHEWSKEINDRLLKLEREVFLAGNEKTFLLFMDSCNICKTCADERIKCINKESARPAPESLAVDVFSTVRKFDYPIAVLRDYSVTMNRYAFLLIK